MHAVGLHSALAIKRQRQRRDEQRRARERRYSSQSGESGVTSPRASTYSLDQNTHVKRHCNKHYYNTQRFVDSKVVTSIGMLHIGVVFLVSGIFLLISGILPDQVTILEKKAPGKWWNELIAIGVFLVIFGFFLMLLNSIISRKEENELEQYVRCQLTRSKSGHRLERDIETGGLTPKHLKHQKDPKNSDKSIKLCNQSIVKESTSKDESLHPNYKYVKKECITTKSSHDGILELIAEEELIYDNINAPSPDDEYTSKTVSKKNIPIHSFCSMRNYNPLCGIARM